MPSVAIHNAMHSPERWVVSLVYLDSKGRKTRRIVSPIRFLPNGRFLGLCLCRCEPRQFHLQRCSEIQMQEASDFVMPVQLETVA